MKTNREDVNQIFVGLLEAVGIDTHKGEFFVEEWRFIKDTNDMYEVSDMGRVRCWKNRNGKFIMSEPRIIDSYLGTQGYLCVRIVVNGVAKKIEVHRLVAETFIPNPENKPQVNHKNQPKTNNSIENLEWVTQEENYKHAVETGLTKILIGENNPRTIPIMVYKNGILVTTIRGEKQRKEFCLANKIDVSNIYACLAGKRKTAKGYTFKKE